MVDIVRVASRSITQFVALRLSPFAIMFVVTVLLLGTAFAQESPKPPVIPSTQARLTTARSIFIEHAGGRLPNEIIGDAFQGWGRYVVVFDPRKADLIVSINAIVSDAGVSAARSSRAGSTSSTDSRTLSSSAVIQIHLLILDAHDRVVLWSGSQQPKSSLTGKRREDNEIEASLALFRRFRDKIEPEPAPEPEPAR